MSEGIQRRLAAVVSVDAVGYARLIGEDETGTLAALRGHREALIDPLVARHGGRIVKTMGDGLLLEFPSVVNGMQCAVEIQKGMAARNAALADDRCITFRIGVNLGDVIVEGEDILGDGVNVAARLQQIAAPGGIALSDRVYEDVQSRLDAEFQDAGEQALKNIVRPVRVWRWSPAAAPATPPGTATDDEALPLPDKPSIAVLPFDNMSDDADQAYFADGITEDIITALSYVRWLFVIARNSTFTYKSRAVDITQVGRELGVRYVLEGSVRKAGRRIRVTAQLINAATGAHIWGERYDRNLVDIFDVQDELTRAICAKVDVELADSERAMAHRKPGADLDAWDLCQRGHWHFYRQTKDELARARDCFQRAIAVAPEFAGPYAALAAVAHAEATLGYMPDPAARLADGRRDAERAVALDERDCYGHYALGRIYVDLGDRERAITAMERSIELNPSFAQGFYGLAVARVWFGMAGPSLDAIDQAIRLSPHDPAKFSFFLFRAAALYFLGRFDEAVGDAATAIQLRPDNFWCHLALAANLSALERTDEARRAFEAGRDLRPELSASYIRSLIGNYHEPYLRTYLGDLGAVGLPPD